MSETKLRSARIVSGVAATGIALACGTNYAYSAWGPQFAEKLKLSSTEQNLIGISANMGMYTLGIPIGMFVDSKGARLVVVFGAILLGAGYFSLHNVYQRGSGNIPLSCLFSFFTGLGGCAAFAAATKISALNWPYHRGTATGFPMAAFGLSAFFFSSFAASVLSGDTGDFLMLLATGTFGLVIVGFFFLRVYPYPQHLGLVESECILESNRLRRTSSDEESARSQRAQIEPVIEVLDGTEPEENETSSLMPKASFSGPEDANKASKVKNHVQNVDIRGLEILSRLEFWQQFILIGILAGIGLMTINNIGNDTKALWRHYDDSASEDFIMKHEALQVSIFSVASFLGRIASGVGSDILSKTLKSSRLWCFTIASLIFLVAQLLAISLQSPHSLFLVSSFTGTAYGFLFGFLPSLTAETFGINGLSQNWGVMMLSPIASGNLFNLFYGIIYDSHSVIKPDGGRECTQGLACYRSAYLVTVVACLAGFFGSLWSIWSAYRLRQEEEKRLDQ